MNQFSGEENKGQYCKFVQTANGSYVLQPVKVPAHVIAERAERVRRREIHRHVEKNRRRAQELSGRTIAFLSAALGLFVIVCCLYLGVQNKVNTRMTEIASLQTQIERLSQDNDVAEKRLAMTENINEIETEARDRLGMQGIRPDQIVYYASENSDYMLQYSSVKEAE